MKFTIGNVFTLFIDVFKKSFGKMLAITGMLIVVWIVSGVIGAVVPNLSPGLKVLASGLQMVIGYTIFLVYFCALTKIALLQIADKPVLIGAILRDSLALALPALGLGIIWYIGWMLGLVLLVIPGILFTLVFAVPFPALVQDRTGVIGSLARSRDLTRNRRWAILGLNIVVNIALYAVAFIVYGVTMAGNDSDPNIVKILLSFVLALVCLGALLMVPPVMNASVYAVLRADKGEPLTGDLETVF